LYSFKFNEFIFEMQKSRCSIRGSFWENIKVIVPGGGNHVITLTDLQSGVLKSGKLIKTD